MINLPDDEIGQWQVIDRIRREIITLRENLRLSRVRVYNAFGLTRHDSTMIVAMAIVLSPICLLLRIRVMYSLP